MNPNLEFLEEQGTGRHFMISGEMNPHRRGEDDKQWQAPHGTEDTPSATNGLTRPPITPASRSAQTFFSLIPYIGSLANSPLGSKSHRWRPKPKQTLAREQYSTVTRFLKHSIDDLLVHRSDTCALKNNRNHKQQRRKPDSAVTAGQTTADLPTTPMKKACFFWLSDE